MHVCICLNLAALSSAFDPQRTERYTHVSRYDSSKETLFS